jgi:hypothetical protein
VQLNGRIIKRGGSQWARAALEAMPRACKREWEGERVFETWMKSGGERMGGGELRLTEIEKRRGRNRQIDKQRRQENVQESCGGRKECEALTKSRL